jgi:hypothetical protein
VPRIQFSRAAACTPQVLEQLDQCCQRSGARILVRFFGFCHEEFDVEILRRVPSVRALLRALPPLPVVHDHVHMPRRRDT